MYSIQTLTADFRPSGIRLAQSPSKADVLDLWIAGVTVLCWSDEQPLSPLRRWSPEAVARNRRKRAVARIERDMPLFAAQLTAELDDKLAADFDHLRRPAAQS